MRLLYRQWGGDPVDEEGDRGGDHRIVNESGCTGGVQRKAEQGGEQDNGDLGGIEFESDPQEVLFRGQMLGQHQRRADRCGQGGQIHPVGWGCGELGVSRQRQFQRHDGLPKLLQLRQALGENLRQRGRAGQLGDGEDAGPVLADLGDRWGRPTRSPTLGRRQGQLVDGQQ